LRTEGSAVKRPRPYHLRQLSPASVLVTNEQGESTQVLVTSGKLIADMSDREKDELYLASTKERGYSGPVFSGGRG
jgi:hypothetical protein